MKQTGYTACAAALGIAVLLMLFGCTTATQLFRQPEQPVRITIIQTGDIKGNIIGGGELGKADTSLAQKASFIEDRRNKKEHVLLFDLGNMTAGGREGYYSSHIDTAQRHVQAEILRYLQYDGAVLGSRDLLSGMTVYQRIRRESAVPWLSANIVHQATGEQHTVSQRIFERDGLRIGVFGLTHPDMADGIPDRLIPGIQLKDMQDQAQRTVRELREYERADVVIALIHARDDSAYRHTVSKYDQKIKKDYQNEILQLAREVEGIDVIFTNAAGDDYREIVQKPDGRDVHIICSGAGNPSIGLAEIIFFRSRDTDGARIQSISSRVTSVAEYEPSKGLLDRFSAYSQRTESFTDQQVGQLEEGLSTRESLFRYSAFMEMIHRMQLSVTNAHISFAAPPACDVALGPGEIRRSDFFKMFPTESYLFSLRLTGREIADYLEYSYDQWFRTMQGPYDNFIQFSKDDDTGEISVNCGDFDSAHGLRYTVDVTKPPGNRVEISGLTNGRPFRLEETYIVAMNSYRVSGGGGHLTEGAGIARDEIKGRILSASSRDFRHHLIRWFQQQDGFSPRGEASWRAVPESWAAAGRLNDYPLLFNQYPEGR